jgi:hypothetical protein
MNETRESCPEITTHSGSVLGIRYSTNYMLHYILNSNHACEHIPYRCTSVDYGVRQHVILR